MLPLEWIPALGKELKRIRVERKDELDKINDILGEDPRQLAPLYVPVEFQSINPANVEKEAYGLQPRIPFHKWLNVFVEQPPSTRDGRQISFVLADAGMGKTCLLAMMKLTELGQFWPRNIRFHLIKLGPETLDELKGLDRHADTILLLDSLDEDPTSFGRVEERIADLLDAAKNFRQTIITSRTQFFPKTDQFEEKGQVRFPGYECHLFYLSPFSEEQVDEYLAKRFPHGVVDYARMLLFLGEGSPDRAKAKDLVVSNMRDLRMRPLLLSRIQDLMDSDETHWDLYTTYKALVDVWLDREIRRMGPNAGVTAEELLKSCEGLAVRLHQEGVRALSPEELNELIAKSGLSTRLTGVQLGGQSLLNKNSLGSYRFAHLSIQEFLVAKSQIEAPGTDLGPFSREIEEFIEAWFRRATDEHQVAFMDSTRAHEGDFERLRRALGQLRTIFYFQRRYRGKWGFEANSELPEGALRVEFHGRGLPKGSFKAHVPDWPAGQLLGFDRSLQGAYLQDANLRGANLRGASLVGANLQDANLQDANLQDAILQDANLQDAILQVAFLLKANLRGANLLNADLQNADLHRANLEGATLQDANLRGAYLLNADLQNATLEGADLQGAYLRNADLQHADLQHAKLQGAKLQDAKLQNAKLQYADLRDATLQDANLRGANLLNADLQNATLEGAILQNADLQNADLQYAKLQGANLQNADLQGANLPRGFKR